MADEQGFKSDVGVGTAIVPASHKEAAQLARIVGGELPSNRGVFWCMTCGFSKDGESSKYPRGLTLDFDDDEMKALDGDPYSHQGPCPVCNKDTLVNYAMMGGEHFSVRGRASENRRKEYSEAADVFFEKARENIGSVLTGVVPGSALSDPSPPSSGPSRDNLPDAGDVDLSDLNARKG
jgi:hypothetical protein